MLKTVKCIQNIRITISKEILSNTVQKIDTTVKAENIT